MLPKAKKLTSKLFRAPVELKPADVAVARRYIADYWKTLERSHPKDDETLLGLPHPYIVPAHEIGHEFDFNEMYYWDTYFTSQGLLDADHKALLLGMLDNLLFMFKRFGVIPNASRSYFAGRSQPPFLTTLIFDLYETYNMDNKWLAQKIAVAQDEYFNVWMGSAKPHWRRVYEDLSRYYDINVLHDLAEAESGWDMTPRFNRKALNFLPVDLNALLYKYESDFAKAAQLLNKTEEARTWQEKAEERAQTMNQLMWSHSRGFYYDYNYAKEKRGTVMSLAGYYPMWAGMVSLKQAEKLVKNLRRFEERGGLATTDIQQLIQFMPSAVPTQWAYPNGWAPLHFIVVKALERYGYHDDARRIAHKWLSTNLKWFNTHGQFLEKYNVVQPEKPPAKGVYPTLTGFSWTNAVFERFCREYVDHE